MRIVIVANFTRALDGERENRFSYLADAFSKRGHEVELIISDFSHGQKKTRPLPHFDKYDFKITMCHEPGYCKNVSIKRLFSHYVWGHNVFKYLKHAPKPDVIYVAVPSLTAAAKISKYCKKNNVKFVTDVQDLWPEAFSMAIKNIFLQKAFLPMQWHANTIYSNTDLAIAVSETYVKRILSINKKGAKGLSVYLGNNGELFDEGTGKYKLERKGNDILLCYIGTMSESYDIPCVLDALKYIKDNKLSSSHIRFILIGNGAFLERFEKYAVASYPDSEFLGRKPYVEMAGLLASCDMAINPIVKGSAASIINKVGDYALAGLPVINTQESPEYRKLLDDYGCGINCECGNPRSLAEAIVKLASNPELRSLMGKESRRLAEERFDRRGTYEAILDSVENLLK